MARQETQYKEINTKNGSDFKTGDAVVYEGHNCIVKNKNGQKCLGIPMPLGWSYFIPNWPEVKKV